MTSEQTREQWLKDGKYLPEFMRDFHDQKFLFKFIGEIVQGDKDDIPEQRRDLPNWSAAHIYVVDYFLWLLARRGYTLQKSRAKLPFRDIETDMAVFRERLAQEQADVLNTILRKGIKNCNEAKP